MKLLPLTIPDSFCQWRNPLFCVLYLATEKEMEINLTLVSMMFKGIITNNCRYGGMAVYDDNKHLLDICDDHGIKRPKRNVYSSNSNFKLVVYAYSNLNCIFNHTFPSQSYLDVLITLSTTQCKPVRFNFCEYNKHCVGNHFSKECSEFLMQSSSNTYFDFESYVSTEISLKYNHIGHSLASGKCGIIQTSSDFIGIFDTCDPNKVHWSGIHATFFPTLLQNQSNSLLHHIVTSYMQDGKHIKGRKVFEMQGTPDILNVVKVHRAITENHNCFTGQSSKMCKHEDDGAYYVDFITEMPITKSDVQICVMLVDVLDSYVDIIIEHRVSHYRNDPQMEINELLCCNGTLQNSNLLKDDERLVFQMGQIGDCYRLPKNRYIIFNITATGEMVSSEIFFPNFCLKKYQRTLFDYFNLSCLRSEVYLTMAGGLQSLDFTIVRLAGANVYATWQKAVPNQHRNFGNRQIRNFEMIARYNTTVKAIKIKGQNGIYHLRLRNEKMYFYPIYVNEVFSGKKDFCTHVYRTEQIFYYDYMYQSWNSAQKICNETGGHLPEFNSRKDLEEFVSLLKLRPDLPVLEAIYIGLRLNPDTRVSKTKESMCVNKRLKVEPFTSKGCYTGIVLTLQTSLSPYVHH